MRTAFISAFSDFALYAAVTIAVIFFVNFALTGFPGIASAVNCSDDYVLRAMYNGIFPKVFRAVAHGLGNLREEKTGEHEYTAFRVVRPVTAILCGTAWVGIYACADEGR